MMFTLLSQQKARDSAGYTVQVADRTHVEYIDGYGKASVEVEFGRPISVFASTISDWLLADTRQPMTTAQQTEIISRIAAGLEAMGSTVEIC